MKRKKLFANYYEEDGNIYDVIKGYNHLLPYMEATMVLCTYEIIKAIKSRK